jgi:SAM-dependent methyltransferase
MRRRRSSKPPVPALFSASRMADEKENDPTRRFTGRAEDYARYRPTYPAAAIDAILAGLGPPRSLVAVDVGTGTGISARLLADRGSTVIAVEPNPAMLREAAPHERVLFVEGSAEAIPLRTGWANLVLAAQAYHWFRADEAVREMARVLRPGGRLALVWNRRSTRDALGAGYRDALLSLGVDPALEAMNADILAVGRSGLFGPLEVARFEHEQALALPDFIGRGRSASYVPKSGREAERFVALLRDLHARHARADGAVRFAYETEVMLATRLGAAITSR